MALVAIPARFCSGGQHKIRDRWIDQVEHLCTTFHVLVSSGYRTAAANRDAGGASNSDHLRGDAADFVGSAVELAALFRYADGRFPYLEPMAESRTHVHISFAHAGVSTPVGGETKRIKTLRRLAAVHAVIHLSKAEDVDWKAATAVAFEEGHAGYIGDDGSSYGPWQLHIGGALPAKWARLGRYSDKTLAWSWSLPGFAYAIGAMARNGAAGKRGHAATRAIVYGFEHPHDPATEARNAATQYDWLTAQGEHEQSAAADWYFGPHYSAGQPAVPPDITGAVPPAHREPVPVPGVAKAWREVVASAGNRPRSEHVKVDKLGASLLDTVKG